jgi:antirestriction protein ArdC
VSRNFQKKRVDVDASQKASELVLNKLKSGQIPWAFPYQSNDYTEFTSFLSGEPYKGINKVLLWIAKQESQLQSNGFLTFSQATRISGIDDKTMADVRSKKMPDVTLKSVNHPLANEKSVGHVVVNILRYQNPKGDLWKPKAGGKQRPSKDEIKSEGLKEVWLSNVHRVWSVDQMSHIPEKYMAKLDKAKESLKQDQYSVQNQDEKIKSVVQSIIKKSGVKVVTGDKPSYDHDRDVIIMPKINSFVSDSSFYRALMHQIVHWTGHKNRLNRNLGGLSFEDSTSSRLASEELVTELGTAFLCQKLGINSFTSSNLEYHDSKITSWIKLMEQDNSVLKIAASRADKAMNYLVKTLEMEVKKENIQELSL